MKNDNPLMMNDDERLVYRKKRLEQLIESNAPECLISYQRKLVRELTKKVRLAHYMKRQCEQKLLKDIGLA